MIRSFLPVGQGAFYCERFEDSKTGKRINVVYDCGSISPNHHRILREQIQDHFDEREDIEAVFISHFECELRKSAA